MDEFNYLNEGFISEDAPPAERIEVGPDDWASWFRESTGGAIRGFQRSLVADLLDVADPQRADRFAQLNTGLILRYRLMGESPRRTSTRLLRRWMLGPLTGSGSSFRILKARLGAHLERLRGRGIGPPPDTDFHWLLLPAGPGSDPEWVKFNW